MLGSNVSDTLFGEGIDPTDVQIRVRNHVFRVLGVMATKGSSGGGMNMDDQVFVPYTTVMKKLTGQAVPAAASTCRQPRPTAILPTTQAVTASLRASHGLAAGRAGRLHDSDARRHRGAPHADHAAR